MSLIVILLVGLIAGWLASLLVKGSGSGVIVDVVIGVIGALIGGYLFSWLGVYSGSGLFGSILTALIGAVILLIVLRLVYRTA